VSLKRGLQGLRVVGFSSPYQGDITPSSSTLGCGGMGWVPGFIEVGLFSSAS
jgi:hypothetical protein